MNEWSEQKFRKLLNSNVKNGIYKKKEFHGSGCKIVNMGELFSHPRLFDVPMQRVDLNSSEKSRFLLKKGDFNFCS